MSIQDNVALLFAALLLEAAFGYPNAVFAAIGHPVTWIGALITWLDQRLNRADRSQAARRAGGLGALVVLVAVAAGWGAGLAWLGRAAGFAGWVAVVLATSSLFAQRSLHEHVARVSAALRRGGMEGGRAAVAQIVGRNPANLDEPAICRAAIESLAENFSDGIVAPAVWLAAGGLPGGAVYKAVNTADSMIGHRTTRHAAFGWASARLDDGLNLPASRLSALLIIVAAGLSAGSSAGGAWRATWRDARRHRSPNAGWPEAAMAGALGLRLAGPRVYGTTLVADDWMGDGRSEATPDDIDRALELYRRACGLLMALAGGLTLLLLAR